MIALTKTQLNKLLVEERKTMRAKQAQSDFMRRTLTIFNSQNARAKELNVSITYGLEQFREWFRAQLERGTCHYCKSKVTVKKLCADHGEPVSRGGQFTLENLVGCDSPCNFQKGKMNSVEFTVFNALINTFPPEVSTDIRRRLSLGGKWVSKQ